VTRLYALSAVALTAVFLGAIGWFAFFGRSDDPFAGCRTGQVAGTAQIGGPFTLVNAQGQTVTEKEVITEPSLVYFGYTFCPDVCPLDNVRNAAAVDLLAERGIAVTPVFISVDPDRDTPEVVGEFAEVMHPKMIGLTGSPEQVKAASQAYKTYYRKQESDDNYYLVDHSVLTYLVFPEHGFVEFFRRDVTPEQMADQVACFVNAAS
jgi:protein SCO1/2